MTARADWRRWFASVPGPGADGDVVPIGDPEEDEGYGDDEDDEDEDEDDDEEETWQVADASIVNASPRAESAAPTCDLASSTLDS